MAWRNGPDGYGAGTKVLHWLTVAALAAQFTVGYVMDADESGRGRGRGRGGESGHGRGRGRGGDDEALLEQGWSLVTAHVALGLLILGVAFVRVLWRRTGLPPWAETLSARERVLAHWTERALLTLLFLVPASGLLLVVVDDDLLVLHVVGHVCFFVALAMHVGLVLKHEFVDRDRLLSRMT